jgi:hypothetical protein
MRLRRHDLRHTFGSRPAQAGVALQAIKELMGHSGFSVTLRYAHLAPGNLRQSVMVLDRPVPANEVSKSRAGATHGTTQTRKEGEKRTG